jgi:hypothetical protein
MKREPTMPEREHTWSEVFQVLDEVHTKHSPTIQSPEEEEEWIAQQVKAYRNQRGHHQSTECGGNSDTEKKS